MDDFRLSISAQFLEFWVEAFKAFISWGMAGIMIMFLAGTILIVIENRWLNKGRASMPTAIGVVFILVVAAIFISRLVS